MILVTGATGNTGGLVAEGLRARGVPFRAMSRSEAKRKALEARGVPAIHGDFQDPASLRAALDGVDTAYLVCTPDERLVACEQRFIAAAKEAGVKKIVKCGAHSTSHDAGSPNLRMHAVVEDALRASGLRYVFLRPHGFMQTYFHFSAPMIMGPGLMPSAANDGPMPLIDVRDVGEIAVKALLEDTFDNQAYDLTGPVAIRPSQMAAALSKALGKPITYVESQIEMVDGMMRQMGVPDAPREHVIWGFREQESGRFDYVSRGHEAFGITLRTYDDFAADLAAGKTGAATSDFAS